VNRVVCPALLLAGNLELGSLIREKDLDFFTAALTDSRSSFQRRTLSHRARSSRRGAASVYGLLRTNGQLIKLSMISQMHTAQ